MEKFDEFMRSLPLPVRILVAVITVVGGVMLVTHSQDEVSGFPVRVQPVASVPSNVGGLIVLTHAWGADRVGNRIVTGTVANRTARPYGSATVEVGLYGPDGSSIGQASAKTARLDPGATTRFEAVVKDEAAVSYKIMGVSAF